VDDIDDEAQPFAGGADNGGPSLGLRRAMAPNIFYIYIF